MTTPWNPEATDQDYLAAAREKPMTPPVTGHTPGPWTVMARGPVRSVVAGTQPVADLYGGVDKPLEVVDADARLIALAPELAEALLALVLTIREDVPAHACPGFDCVQCRRPDLSAARALLARLDGAA